MYLVILKLQQWIGSHDLFISPPWCCLLRVLPSSNLEKTSCCECRDMEADFLSWMNYSWVISGGRESADLQRTFILAVIQPERERERGADMPRNMLPTIQTHMLPLIKPKLLISALFLPSKFGAHIFSGWKKKLEKRKAELNHCFTNIIAFLPNFTHRVSTLITRILSGSDVTASLAHCGERSNMAAPVRYALPNYCLL